MRYIIWTESATNSVAVFGQKETFEEAERIAHKEAEKYPNQAVVVSPIN